jgi:hypothetical protein
MLPEVEALFTLVRQLARRSTVTAVAAPKWLVQRHGLAAMACRAGATSYRDDLVRATIEWTRIEREVPPVVAALTRAGVRTAPIKGLAYAKTLYAAPAERPMGDVDLLVPRREVDGARAVLAGLGFVRGARAALHHAEPWTRGSLAIDLHWTIIAPGRSRVDLDAVWTRMTSGWPDGAERLEAVDALVFHLIHLARNRLRLPLVNVVDAARLIEIAPAAEAMQRALAWGLETAVGLALQCCERVLEGADGHPVGHLGPSATELALLVKPGLTRKLAFDIATAGSARQLASRAVHFGANELRRLARRGQ